jgi:hypothetical protein
MSSCTSYSIKHTFNPRGRGVDLTANLDVAACIHVVAQAGVNEIEVTIEPEDADNEANIAAVRAVVVEDILEERFFLGIEADLTTPSTPRIACGSPY